MSNLTITGHESTGAIATTASGSSDDHPSVGRD
jgi:hypothetical protein